MSSGSGERAVLREAVACCAENGRTLAPRGEYEIQKNPNSVGLCSCVTQNRFTLSFDAFLQHLNEGRILVSER